VTHGTRGRYRAGCRCGRCRSANSYAERLRRAGQVERASERAPRRRRRELPIAFDPSRKNPLVIGGAQYTPAMSFKEIAARLGMTKQSVWNTYAVALEKIRRQIRIHPTMFGALLTHREADPGQTFPDHDLE
jgi:hypothetical protein